MRYVRLLMTGVDVEDNHTTKEYELRLGDQWVTMEPPEETQKILFDYIQQVMKDLADYRGAVA